MGSKDHLDIDNNHIYVVCIDIKWEVRELRKVTTKKDLKKKYAVGPTCQERGLNTRPPEINLIFSLLLSQLSYLGDDNRTCLEFRLHLTFMNCE